MIKAKIKELWGSYLYSRLLPWIDEEGYIENDWVQLIEENYSDWDADYNDTNELKEIYQRMYQLNFEDNEEKTKIRPVCLG